VISINLRLILAVPIYLLGGIVGLAGIVTELGALYGLITLDIATMLGCLIGGAILAVIAAVCFGIAGVINGGESAP
jgi:hypothetical protein